MGLKTKTLSGEGFLRERVHSVPMKISSTCIDAGNTGQTHILRAGLLLAVITSGGELAHYAPAASDGTQTAYGILMHEVDLKDDDPAGTSVDHYGDILLKGTVKSSACPLWDSAAQVDFGRDIIGL